MSCGIGRIFLLDAIDYHFTGLSGELCDGLEVDSAANRWDVCKGLENIGVANGITVIEQDHRCQGGVSRDQSRYDMSLRV